LLKNKTLEEVINDWSNELEENVRVFTKQAVDVSKWDQSIMENGDKVYKLHTEVKRVQVSQKELEQNLEIISTQQNELSSLLDSLESEVDGIVADSDLTPTDIEREKGYQMAEDINAQLDQMATTLKDLVSKLNLSQEKNGDGENPVFQIVKILNAHLNSLQWIDQNSSYLQSKLQEVSRIFATQKAETERIQKRDPLPVRYY